MLEFSKDMLDVGKCLPADKIFNVKDLLPSNVTIKSAISRIARTFHLEFSNKVNQARDMGGSITTAAMTLGSTCYKYYEFNLNYFNVSTTLFATSPTKKLMVLPLLLKMRNGPSTSTLLRTLFDDCVKENVAMQLDYFTARMT